MWMLTHCRLIQYQGHTHTQGVNTEQELHPDAKMSIEKEASQLTTVRRRAGETELEAWFSEEAMLSREGEEWPGDFLESQGWEKPPCESRETKNLGKDQPSLQNSLGKGYPDKDKGLNFI